ncbi:MAG: thioredoxin-dependent thiol peroxidase [Bacteroidota bacterium]
MIHLKEGDKAPEINAVDHQGNVFVLSAHQGKKVILYFYPKDDTPGCTAEACNLRDNYQALVDKGFDVVGVSPDPAESHQKFITKYELPFTLIPDPDKTILQDYGVWGEKNRFGKKSMGVNRTTFVIDENGFIEKIFEKVDTKDHTNQILNAY